MDPNACFRRILDAIADQDIDEYCAAFADLAAWLERGGFAPTVVTLGIGERAVHRGTEHYKRRTLSDSPFAKGRTHCMSSKLAAARAARPKGMRKMPVALRRGWAKCVVDTLAEYRGLYIAVNRGRL